MGACKKRSQGPKVCYLMIGGWECGGSPLKPRHWLYRLWRNSHMPMLLLLLLQVSQGLAAGAVKDKVWCPLTTVVAAAAVFTAAAAAAAAATAAAG